MHLLHSVWNRLSRQDGTGRGRKKPKQNTLLSGGGSGRARGKGRGASSDVDPNTRFLGDQSWHGGTGGGAGGAV